MTIATGKITPEFSIPVTEWPIEPSYLQSFAYAKDPTNGLEYVFVAQAVPIGKGDIQDLHLHRHRLVNDTVIYMDSMTCLRFGHGQTMHVRISAKGNTWLWLARDVYNSRGRLTGTSVVRALYRRASIDVSSKNVQRIYTGTGTSTRPISCPEFKVVLRRSKGLYEIYEEYEESALLLATERNRLPKPLRTFHRLKTPYTFQGACASSKSVWVTTGATDRTQMLYQHDWTAKRVASRNISKINAPIGTNTSTEPEGVGLVRGVLHFGKRYNSVARRLYYLFGIRW